MDGKWSVRLELVPKLNLVRCTSYASPAGRQYQYQVATGPSDISSEYGVERGGMYVLVEVGPDGAGKQRASMTASWNDGDLFTAHQSLLEVDRGLKLVFSGSPDSKRVQVAAVAVAGPEFAYGRSDGVGSVSLVVSIRCP